MTTKDALLEELHVGTRGVFADAGFSEVSRPTLRRVVMRLDLWPALSGWKELSPRPPAGRHSCHDRGRH